MVGSDFSHLQVVLFLHVSELCTDMQVLRSVAANLQLMFFNSYIIMNLTITSQVTESATKDDVSDVSKSMYNQSMNA